MCDRGGEKVKVKVEVNDIDVQNESSCGGRLFVVIPVSFGCILPL